MSNAVIDQALVGKSTSYNASNGTSAANSPQFFANTNNSLQQTQAVQQANPTTDSFTSALSAGKGVNSFLDFTDPAKSSTGLFSGLGSKINAFGAENLGLGFGGPAGTGSLASETISPALAAADPSLAGMTTSAAAADGSLGASSVSLGGILGGAAFGAGVGGFLNSKNPVNGMIGGALGGALGAATGITSGIAMGATLGSIVPGLGTVIGAVVGGLGSRLFGNKTAPTTADAFATHVDSTGALTNPSYTSKNAGNSAGYAQNEAESFSKVLSQASKDLGINFNKDVELEGGYNSKYSGGPQPGYLRVFNGNTPSAYFIDPNDTASQSTAFKSALQNVASQSGYTNMDALNAWFDKYNPNAAAPTAATSLIPNAAPQGPSPFEQFLTQYKANQNANAAPVAA